LKNSKTFWLGKNVSSTQFDQLYNSADEIGRLLAGFMAYLKQSDLRGKKFK